MTYGLQDAFSTLSSATWSHQFQRSIAAFISRSYDWLLAESCRLFDRLSVRLRIVAVGVGVQV